MWEHIIEYYQPISHIWDPKDSVAWWYEVYARDHCAWIWEKTQQSAWRCEHVDQFADADWRRLSKGWVERECLNFCAGEHLVNNPWPSLSKLMVLGWHDDMRIILHSLWGSAARRKVERAQVQRFDERLATQAWFSLGKSMNASPVLFTHLHSKRMTSSHKRFANELGRWKCSHVGTLGQRCQLSLCVRTCQNMSTTPTAPNERRSEWAICDSSFKPLMRNSCRTDAVWCLWRARSVRKPLVVKVTASYQRMHV